MGTITERKTKSGKVKYLATVRIKRQNLPAFNKSKTFETQAQAQVWLEKVAKLIDDNPAILTSKKPKGDTLAQYINRYVAEVKDQFGDKYTTNKLQLI